jgi:hypothetical protein
MEDLLDDRRQKIGNGKAGLQTSLRQPIGLAGFVKISAYYFEQLYRQALKGSRSALCSARGRTLGKDRELR